MRRSSSLFFDSDKGVIVANGINPKYGQLSPYWMAASAIDEALRQIIAVGGNLKRVALLDNFCWGDTRKPEMLGALIEARRPAMTLPKFMKRRSFPAKTASTTNLNTKVKLSPSPIRC